MSRRYSFSKSHLHKFLFIIVVVFICCFVLLYSICIYIQCVYSISTEWELNVPDISGCIKKLWIMLQLDEQVCFISIEDILLD